MWQGKILLGIATPMQAIFQRGLYASSVGVHYPPALSIQGFFHGGLHLSPQSCAPPHASPF